MVRKMRLKDGKRCPKVRKGHLKVRKKRLFDLQNLHKVVPKGQKEACECKEVVSKGGKVVSEGQKDVSKGQKEASDLQRDI